ncbi:MAG: hypothetical protein A6F72_04635 [Cycloclasticus sp. symbiont of Poecilosclerida sp. N]|nr:MAG: hypothetical protein A6F72_04635 [Cycloclasticus sp. symbiont of Poecilosclerida sp. N]
MNERHKRIWAVVKSIPTGFVLTYGEVARFAGYPRGARMIGSALGTAPDECNLPWHRIINSQGKISFPAGSDKALLQKKRLEEEGIVFLAGAVNLQQYAWQGNLDSELWQM